MIRKISYHLSNSEKDVAFSCPLFLAPLFVTYIGPALENVSAKKMISSPFHKWFGFLTQYFSIVANFGSQGGSFAFFVLHSSVVIGVPYCFFVSLSLSNMFPGFPCFFQPSLFQVWPWVFHCVCCTVFFHISPRPFFSWTAFPNLLTNARCQLHFQLEALLSTRISIKNI